MHQEARLPVGPGAHHGALVHRRHRRARQPRRARSHVISQSSGVSVRLSIANFETVVANALRRTLRTHDAVVVPRVSDLSAVVQSTQGKIEFDTMDDSDVRSSHRGTRLARRPSVLCRESCSKRPLRSSKRSTLKPSCTPATTCPTRLHGGARGHARRSRRPLSASPVRARATGRRRRRRVHSRRPVSHQAPRQGRLGCTGPLPLEEPIGARSIRLPALR